jgi:hypothetical protein
MITEIEITSVGQLIDQVTPSEPDPVTGRHRDTGVYRGSFDPARPLLTSLDRLGGVDPPHTKARLEGHILRNFIRYSRPYLPHTTPSDDWELLFTAQHHGVPTRLLDWTYSPLVAAHFATSARPAHQGPRAIWRLDWMRVHEAFGLPRLAMLIQDLHEHCGHGNPFTPWDLFDLDGPPAPFACMVDPPSLDARIVSQAATFTISSDASKSFDAFLEEHGLADALTKFIIPAESVPRVRDQLDLATVDERRLFPDLDGVAAAIRRYYA